MSVYEDDPGFAAYESALREGKRVFVFLDGVECSNGVSTADEEAGFIVRAKRDADGDIYAVGDEVAVETVHGVVTITVIDSRLPVMG